jgi:HAD superfamily hydrolase (TIGR01484 family)
LLKISEMTNENWSGIRVLLTDIDDTVTTDGRLTAEAYSALEAAQAAGYIVIPVTGRCAGWCDHIARMWPVDAVVGENGAFYFRYDHAKKKMHQYFCQSKTERHENAQKLENISADIFKLVPGTAIASDQPYRITDLAIDFAEDVEPLPRDEVQKIATLAKSNGATAKISSIHVNCWFGAHSKLATSILLLETQFGMSKEVAQHSAMFVGDSPNDETMFGYFTYSVGVANIQESLAYEFQRPAFVTEHKGGKGFAEVVHYLLQTKASPHFEEF